MKVHIRGAAEDVRLGDIDEITLDIDQILLPVDGSEPSVVATQYAVALAKTFQAKIAAIYVDTGQDAMELPEEIEAEDQFEGSHHSVQGLMIAKKMCERNGVDVSVGIVQGGIAKRIIAMAAETDADMIVMGDTGRTAIKRLALGSIADTVVKGSHIPVLVVKAD
jgi:nucleotide-binding universal stress UspA family protein